MPHGMCFSWRPDVLALHVISDALIALAYFSIPLALVALVRRRPDLPFSGVFWGFSLFIVSCGFTHVLSIVVIWHPIYWIEGYVKAVTAVSSVATAVALVPLLPRALALKTPAQLQMLNESLRRANDESHRLLARYEREHYIATTLQQASLGTVPPRIGSLAISAVYRPGASDLEIGGDWYDAFALPDGRVVVSIGDVAGSGLHASLVMAKMRQAIRIAAQVRVVPGGILEAADRALKLEYPDRVVTAFVAIIDEIDGVATFASAGHPSPLVRRADGSLVELRCTGLPLGLRQRDEAHQTAHADLAVGDLLVLFTDGLTEATHDLALGERRLRRALGSDAIAAADDPAGALADAVLVDGARDDVAVIAVRIGDPTDGGARWTFDLADANAAARARGDLIACLRAAGADDAECCVAELVYSELVGNALRHAGGAVDVLVDWCANAPILHVLDRGPGFGRMPGLPPDDLAESGRGLYIVQQMTPEFTILRRPGGGTHARAALAVARPRPVARTLSAA